MMLEKNQWQLDTGANITFTVKAFDFSQSPLVGATVALGKLMRFGGGMPYAELSAPANYSVMNIQNVTDSKGYAMIKIAPPAGGWLPDAEYIAELDVTYGGNTETSTQWFRMEG